MEFVGRNSIVALEDIVKDYRNILVFHGKSIFKRYNTLFTELLTGKEVSYYADFTNNPKKEEIDEAINKFSDRKFDAIIAFGGGSVIDFAKAFRFYKQDNIPLIAIPTTAGTGSEATQFAVVYVDGVKTSLDNISILSDIAIIDSQFIEKAPATVKACCAMDAYCQAIESFWAKGATEESRKYAIEAIELCRDYLIQAVNTDELIANEKMALAAHLAGKAINISRTTAAHALSYKITSKYGIPHGHAVALSIAGLFEQNVEVMSQEQQGILLQAIGIHKIDIRSYFHNLMTEIGLEDNLAKLGVSDLDEIVDSVNLQRLSNNPKNLSRDDLLRVMG